MQSLQCRASQVTSFKFRKIIRRNSFTQVFKGFGERRLVTDYKQVKILCRNPRQRRSLSQRLRRASQGYRNKIFGRLNALKMRLIFGRHKKTPQFRR
jgi:hypothetical protein